MLVATSVVNTLFHYNVKKIIFCVKMFPSNETVMYTFRCSVHKTQIAAVAYIYEARDREVYKTVHSCQQKSIGLNFLKSQTGSDVRYSCHHNSSRITFPLFAHSCRFSVLQFITINHTAYILKEDGNTFA